MESVSSLFSKWKKYALSLSESWSEMTERWVNGALFWSRPQFGLLSISHVWVLMDPWALLTLGKSLYFSFVTRRGWAEPLKLLWALTVSMLLNTWDVEWTRNTENAGCEQSLNLVFDFKMLWGRTWKIHPLTPLVVQHLPGECMEGTPIPQGVGDSTCHLTSLDRGSKGQCTKIWHLQHFQCRGREV